jgi:hypothetical protein
MLLRVLLLGFMRIQVHGFKATQVLQQELQVHQVDTVHVTR